MINFNGTIISEDATVLTKNRLYGDAAFLKQLKINNKILFLEDHYFRLMSAMRGVRMEIEFLQWNFLKKTFYS
jgi:branched-chain amino acid aminotransferase